MLSIVAEEIKLQFEEISEESLLHHKNAMKAHLLKHYIQPENMLWWYGWNIFLAHRVLTIGEHLDSIDSITSKEIVTCAQKYLSIKTYTWRLSAVFPKVTYNSKTNYIEYLVGIIAMYWRSCSYPSS